MTGLLFSCRSGGAAPPCLLYGDRRGVGHSRASSSPGTRACGLGRDTIRRAAADVPSPSPTPKRGDSTMARSLVVLVVGVLLGVIATVLLRPAPLTLPDLGDQQPSI